MEKNDTNKKLVIIPAHNEQENIGQLIAGIRKANEKIDIVVIDDGSTDRTPLHSISGISFPSNRKQQPSW